MSPRHCQRRDGFSWARVIAPTGAVTYRLFWRGSTGKLYMVAGTFGPSVPRADMAKDLRRLRNNTRVMRKALRIAA